MKSFKNRFFVLIKNLIDMIELQMFFFHREMVVMFWKWVVVVETLSFR